MNATERPETRHPSALLRLVAIFALLVAACSISSCRRARNVWERHTAVGRARAAAAAARVRRGHVAYERYCALCHRPDAQGYAADHANAIGNAAFLQIASDRFLHDAIADGRPGTPMSPWGRARGGPLTDATIRDIIAYLRTFARRPFIRVSTARVTGDVERGRALWESTCARCHASRGEGTRDVTSVSHPHFLREASDGFLHHTIEHGRPGTAMESFARLSSQSIDDLIVYIRSVEHFPGPPPPPEYEPPPGLDRLIINPTGQPPQFTLREERYVPSADVARALTEHRRLVILDTRATSDWSANHMAGALPFPFYDIEEMASRLPRDGTWILAYCACPHAASGHVVDELRRRGFQHTAVIDEGITYWTNQGYPTAHAALLHP